MLQRFRSFVLGLDPIVRLIINVVLGCLGGLSARALGLSGAGAIVFIVAFFAGLWAFWSWVYGDANA